MTFEQIQRQLRAVKKIGWVESKRRGDTGVGYTLEHLLGIQENNLKTRDFGRVELKAHRSKTTTSITLFTFNRGAWHMKQKDVIEQFGYTDTNDRKALYCTATRTPNVQGLSLDIVDESLQLIHTSGELIATWLGLHLEETFATKLPSLLFVAADTRINSNEREEFHFVRAELLRQPSVVSILRLIETGQLIVDIRMHLNKKGGVRNHGTAFRMNEEYLPFCFDRHRRLL